MLLGFGWQWTMDRLDESERRYSRFLDPVYPRVPGLRVQAPGGRSPATYTPTSPRRARAPLFRGPRGSVPIRRRPDREFALYPRGYPGVGFRWVCREARPWRTALFRLRFGLTKSPRAGSTCAPTPAATVGAFPGLPLLQVPEHGRHREAQGVTCINLACVFHEVIIEPVLFAGGTPV